MCCDILILAHKYSRQTQQSLIILNFFNNMISKCYMFRSFRAIFIYLFIGRFSTFLEARQALRLSRGTALLFSRIFGTRWGWGVSPTPRPLYPRERPGTHYTGGWVDPGPVWTGGKSRPHWDSVPDRPARSSVAIPTELPDPHTHTHTHTHTHIYIYIHTHICVLNTAVLQVYPLTAMIGLIL